ncbi:DUF4381 domain-containing protein [Photobacterium profundum]|uniref:DUF4381 domain-containing protein n=1 Tax=Photobacterium profundum 3TCK TaxID=314280 RepID=Q1Z9H7_9GAMM|nr:DUF4381 domain-containing protein [Photobacterium profundum]EAS45865.1 hypothetical protein P3TCK_05791 [Photobacterium profundum 3TCK]PSV63013.1 DUF4381 domain-containing protein [Photobacterium profundum]
MTILISTLSTAGNSATVNASSYVLRELVEIPLPASISWWPQTIGWKILGICFVISVLYGSYRTTVHWWHNRYRREALDALTHVNLIQPYAALVELLRITKITLNYAFPTQTASLIGTPLLTFLDATAPTQLNTSLGIRWQHALLHAPDDTVLSHEEIQQLQQQLILWVKHHRRQSTAPISCSDLKSTSSLKSNPNSESMTNKELPHD